MLFSIIVPAFNEAKLLGDTLSAIQRAAKGIADAGGAWELIVCDNNSTDETATIARAAGAQVVFEPLNQIARARNRGASVARGDWLLFVDADTHPSHALFSEVVRVIRSGSVVGGGATLQFDEGGLPARLLLAIWNAISRTLRCAAGSFVFCEAAAFRELGGFNNELFASEELELSNRLRDYGQRSKRRMIILHRYPLVTSARKLRLYRPAAHLKFFLNALLRPERTLKRREACTLWYDGRR